MTNREKSYLIFDSDLKVIEDSAFLEDPTVEQCEKLDLVLAEIRSRQYP